MCSTYDIQQLPGAVTSLCSTVRLEDCNVLQLPNPGITVHPSNYQGCPNGPCEVVTLLLAQCGVFPDVNMLINTVGKRCFLPAPDSKAA